MKTLQHEHSIQGNLKHNNFTFKLIGLLFFGTTAIISCTKNDDINSNAKVFSVPKFRQGLISQIQNSAATTPAGYCFIINQNGVIADSFSTGFANLDVSSGSTIPMTTNTEINIASVTKMFTGIAVLQLIKKNSLSIDSKISNYLPSYWNAASSIKNLTFRELMTHSSGITESNTSWDSLRATANRGLDDPSKPADVYANMNFAIFRAIIPFMRNQADAVSNESSMSQSDFEDWMDNEYIDYMQDNVFTPLGISNAICKPNPSKMLALAFSESNSVPAILNSANAGDWTSICGGGGYYLTTFQLAQCMAYIAQTTVVLDQDQKDLMDDLYMGWDNEDSFMTYAGRAHGKDGALRWDSNNDGIQDQGDAGLQTYAIKFPNKVELSLIINSIPGSSFRSLNNMINTAYDNAWE